MLTMPEIIERESQRYIAVRRQLPSPFRGEVDLAYDGLSWPFARAGVEPDRRLCPISRAR
jgi:hypothetical protein